MWHLDHIFDYS